ncbi:MyfA/PsaA family fimbrial adhesin [Yersinia enterocolitica]
MNMKKFVKKPLAIAVLMLIFGGVANMAHAGTIIQSQDVSASKEVKQGASFKVEFTASPDEIISGRQESDVNVFILKASDSAEHTGWRLVTTGTSEGGYMYDDNGNRRPLHSRSWTWEEGGHNWYITDGGNAAVGDELYVAKGEVVPAGTYHFTGRVEEYLG